MISGGKAVSARPFVFISQTKESEVTLFDVIAYLFEGLEFATRARPRAACVFVYVGVVFVL